MTKPWEKYEDLFKHYPYHPTLGVCGALGVTRHPTKSWEEMFDQLEIITHRDIDSEKNLGGNAVSGAAA